MFSLDDLHPIIRETLAFADADHGATMGEALASEGITERAKQEALAMIFERPGATETQTLDATIFLLLGIRLAKAGLV